MRKISSSYSVTYELKNIKNNTILKKENAVCYSNLYREDISIHDKLILKHFLAEETFQYSRIYIKRLCRICGLKLKFIDKNEIELTGFKDKFYVKLFTSLFRILFECYPSYSEVQYKERNIKFLQSYIVKKNNSGHKDMLERLIYYYQKSRMYQGAGHGISYQEGQVLLLKNIENLKNWNSKKYDYDMQSFFSKKN